MTDAQRATGVSANAHKRNATNHDRVAWVWRGIVASVACHGRCDATTKPQVRDGLWHRVASVALAFPYSVALWHIPIAKLGMPRLRRVEDLIMGHDLGRKAVEMDGCR